MADRVLYAGVACVTDLIVKEGLINLDFADVRAVMREKGKAMMGLGEASGEKRVLTAAEAAISNPLIEDPSIKRASGLLISITGGKDMTLFEVDEAASRIREEADPDANIIVGAIFDEGLEGIVRVSVVATGIDGTVAASQIQSGECALAEIADKLRNENSRSRVELAKYPGPAAPQSVDPYRQSAANQNTIREDVLDIPAFLRRRAVGAARAIEY
jgi:cell division protein FtsZ